MSALTSMFATAARAIEPMYVHNVKEAVLEIVTAVENETLPMEMQIPANVVTKVFIDLVRSLLRMRHIRVSLAQADKTAGDFKGHYIYVSRGEG